jgi:hypothetical protein
MNMNANQPVIITNIIIISKSEFIIQENNSETVSHIKSLVSWSISKENSRTWRVLNPELPRNAVYDCYYNVFKFLSILPDDIAEHLGKLANYDRDSCHTQQNIDMQFLSIMRDYNTDRFKQVYKYDIFKYELRDSKNEIYHPYLQLFEIYLAENLAIGSGTIVWLYRKIKSAIV